MCNWTILLSVVVVIAAIQIVKATKSEFNYETGKRVQDLLSQYTETPTHILRFLAQYREKNAFPHYLQPPDRDKFFKLGDSLLTANPRLFLFFGLENGAFAGVGHSPRFADYREPGESGYRLDDEELMGVMQKHLDSCVDYAGNKIACVLKPGENYIECIDDDCTSLQKCPDEESQRECWDLPTKEERSFCESKVRWCTSYITKTLPANEEEEPTRGYIPYTIYCIDSTGIPTQTPGENSESGPDGLGNCYHEDGITPVNRNIAGDFAYCGGNGVVCNSTFTGGFSSSNYDPRYRPWYIDTKQKQKPNWSVPYEFYNSPEMGITYSHPIYTTDEEGREVFAGVLASDFSLNGIASFLTQNYERSDTIIAIVEEAEPNFIIASSTGSTGVKRVLIDDISQPCPDDFELDQSGLVCEFVRIPIADMNDSKMEEVISTTYLNQKEHNFPQSELISVRVHRSDFDGVYASQTIPFTTTEIGISWRIMIIVPVPVQKEDTIMPGDITFSILLVITSVGFGICTLLLVLFMKNRREKEIIASDWRFTGTFLSGCVLLNLASLVMMGPNTDTLCLTRMWVIHFCFVFALTPLFVKTYRLYKLLGVGYVIPRRQTISNARTALMAVPFMVLELVILLIFTFVDPNKMKGVMEYDESAMTHRVICSHDTWAFFIVQVIYQGGLVLLGCFLAYKTVNMQKEYRDNRQLILTMYNVALVGSIVLVISNAIEVFQSTMRLIVSTGVLWVTSSSCCVFVLPKLAQIRCRKANAVGESRSSQINQPKSNVNYSHRRDVHGGSARLSHFDAEFDEKERPGRPALTVSMGSRKPPMDCIDEGDSIPSDHCDNSSCHERRASLEPMLSAS
ncbi:hypothetical protein ACHAXS_004290 [Conticribra weissflogii]